MPVDQIPIGTFSRITQLSLKALRLYDERGLLVPAARDIRTGYRYYTFAQIERGIRIRHLLWLGSGLSEVEVILDARSRGDVGVIRVLFARRLAATEQEARRLHVIAEILRVQGVTKRPSRDLYTGPYPGVGKAYERIFAYMGEHCLIPAGPARELYLNDHHTVPEDELMTEVQCPVLEEP